MDLLRRRNMMQSIGGGGVLPPDGHIVLYRNVMTTGSVRVLYSIGNIQHIYLNDVEVEKNVTINFTETGVNKVELVLSPVDTLTDLFRTYASGFTDIYLSESFTKVGDNFLFGATPSCALHWKMENITSIGNSAFRCKTVLGVLNFPNLQTMEASAFMGASLTRIDNLGSITTIPASAFREISAGVTSITIPATVTFIGNNAFYIASYNVDFYVLPVTPPTLGTTVWFRTPRNIYVPAASVEAYKSASGWSAYASKIQAIP